MASGTPQRDVGVVGGRRDALQDAAAADKLGRLLDYYAGLAEDRDRPGSLSRGPVEYYLDPDEPPGQWWGSGRDALGLDGEVTGEQLRELLDGRNLTTGTKLGRKFGGKSASGFDCTFSAPKSISVLWALTPDPWVRAGVVAAHETAVDVALGWFEAHGAVTRRGTDGVQTVDARGITGALFAPIEDDQAAKVRAIQQRLGALQTPRPGRGLGL